MKANRQNMVYLPLTEIKPYPNNPRINDDAVAAVAASIREFGAQNPIIVDKHNVIICGHTRLEAAKALGMNDFPVIVADLTEKQARAYRLADNKVSEKARWDIDLLNFELDELQADFDMQEFGFDFELEGFDSYTEAHEAKHQQDVDDCHMMMKEIQNLNKGMYEGVGKYDIPIIEPVYHLPEITEWIGFNYVLSDPNPEGKAVHFFLDDYQFERIWNNPDRYVDKLRQYVCVASPDFSPYGDMPHALQIYNHYRKHWVARYLQEHGVTVIPTIRGSTDERCLEWYLDGEPHNSIVVMSFMWDYKQDIHDKGYEATAREMEILKPIKVFAYGKPHDNITCEVEQIPKFTEKRWGK